MGIFVECNGLTIWEPSLRVGRLFIAQLRAIESVFAIPSGFSEIEADEVEIDPVQLQKFVAHIINALEQTNNKFLLTMVDGCFKIVIALNAKITGEWFPVSDKLAPIVVDAKALLF